MSFLRCKVCLLILLFVGPNAAQGCSSKRTILGNCDCHFIGGCDWSRTPPVPSATPSAALPVGINAFAKKPFPQTTTICEGKLNSLAVLYDCNLRIPLYSARVLGDADIKALYSAKYDRSNDFIESRHLNKLYRQKNGDYGPYALDQIPCYEGGAACKPLCVDETWVKRLPSHLNRCDKKYYFRKGETTQIHRGHLIAASYGRSATTMAQSVKDTFTLSNAVPQFKDLNSGLWNQNEQQLLNWANINCASTSPKRRNGRLFIVVGTIPSTFGKFLQRYFGFPGFSDYQGISITKIVPYKGARSDYKKTYRINVPAVMWTAACCEFEEQVPGPAGSPPSWTKRFINKAFWALNRPNKVPVYNTGFTVGSLFNNICGRTKSCDSSFSPASITIFPQEARCNV